MYEPRWMNSVRVNMDRWGELTIITVEALGRTPPDQVLVLTYGQLVQNFEESITVERSYLVARNK